MHLLKKTYHSSKITEMKNKIPSISSLATNAALTAAEKKLPDVSNLVKKTDYDAKITKIENEYFTTSDYNKFTKDIVDNSIKRKNIATKRDFDAKLQDISKRITSYNLNICLLKMD